MQVILVRGQERYEMFAYKICSWKFTLELRYKKLDASPPIYKVNWRYQPFFKASAALNTSWNHLKIHVTTEEGPIYQKIVLKVWISKIYFWPLFTQGPSRPALFKNSVNYQNESYFQKTLVRGQGRSDMHSYKACSLKVSLQLRYGKL